MGFNAVYLFINYFLLIKFLLHPYYKSQIIHKIFEKVKLCTQVQNMIAMAGLWMPYVSSSWKSTAQFHIT